MDFYDDYEATAEDAEEAVAEVTEEFDDTEVTEEFDDTEAAEDQDTQAFEAYCLAMQAQGSDLSEETLLALWTPPDQRDYQQTELVDAARHPEFETQRSIRTDPDTGKALTDEEGEFVDCPWNTKGAQRPDGMLVDDTEVYLREDKNYGDINNLMQNIKHQTEDRRAAFGDDVDITYVVSPRFTVEECDKLQDYVENTLGAKLEWQLK